ERIVTSFAGIVSGRLRCTTTPERRERTCVNTLPVHTGKRTSAVNISPPSESPAPTCHASPQHVSQSVGPHQSESLHAHVDLKCGTGASATSTRNSRSGLSAPDRTPAQQLPQGVPPA